MLAYVVSTLHWRLLCENSCGSRLEQSGTARGWLQIQHIGHHPGELDHSPAHKRQGQQQWSLLGDNLYYFHESDYLNVTY